MDGRWDPSSASEPFFFFLSLSLSLFLTYTSFFLSSHLLLFFSLSLPLYLSIYLSLSLFITICFIPSFRLHISRLCLHQRLKVVSIPIPSIPYQLLPLSSHLPPHLPPHLVSFKLYSPPSSSCLVLMPSTRHSFSLLPVSPSDTSCNTASALSSATRSIIFCLPDFVYSLFFVFLLHSRRCVLRIQP